MVQKMVEQKTAGNDKNSWNAARILYEIYGADALSSKEWASLEVCPPEGYDKDHKPDSHNKSIYGKLTQKWRECNPQAGEFGALIRSGLINEMRTIPYKDAVNKIPYKDSITQAVVKRIESEPFKERTKKIHLYMDAAEKAVEKQDSVRISEAFESGNFIEENRLSANSTSAERIKKFNDLLIEHFSFGDIYESIIKAELELMHKKLEPQFFRINDIKPKAETGRVQHEIRAVNQTAAKLMRALTGTDSLEKNIDSLEGKYITFLGGGSLPVSGILLHIHTGAKINLIDLDPEAIALSRRLIGNLEKLGIVEEGAIQIVFGDATDMRYQKPLSKNEDQLVSADKVREIIKSSSTSLFVEHKTINYQRRADKKETIKLSTESSVELLADDTFQYDIRYTLPDRNTPYGISFTGYKDHVTETGESYKLVHQIYFDKEKGWKRSVADRRMIPTNVISFAMMLPPQVREGVMNRIMGQTDVPDAALMRSVKGPAEIFYKPTRTSFVSSLRGPFYGEGVLPALVNRVEIYHLPMQQLFRGHYPAKSVTADNENSVPEVNEMDRLVAMKKAIEITTQKLENLKKLTSAPYEGPTARLNAFAAKYLGIVSSNRTTSRQSE